MFSPAHSWCHSWAVVCVYLLLSPRQESLWNGVGLYQGCLDNARLMILLWMGFGQGHSGVVRSVGENGDRAHGVRMVCTVCFGRAPEATFEKSGAGPEGASLQGSTGVECVVPFVQIGCVRAPVAKAWWRGYGHRAVQGWGLLLAHQV